MLHFFRYLRYIRYIDKVIRLYFNKYGWKVIVFTYQFIKNSLVIFFKLLGCILARICFCVSMWWLISNFTFDWFKVNVVYYLILFQIISSVKYIRNRKQLLEQIENEGLFTYDNKEAINFVYTVVVSWFSIVFLFVSFRLNDTCTCAFYIMLHVVHLYLKQWKVLMQSFRGVAQWISASALGAEGRAFESLHLDNYINW